MLSTRRALPLRRPTQEASLQALLRSDSELPGWGDTELDIREGPKFSDNSYWIVDSAQMCVADLGFPRAR